MCTLADYGVEMSKKLGPKGAAAFSAREFIATLCRTYVTGWDPQSQLVDDPGSFDWKVFGSSVSKHFVDAPTMSFMCVRHITPLCPVLFLQTKLCTPLFLFIFTQLLVEVLLPSQPLPSLTFFLFFFPLSLSPPSAHLPTD